jgi:DEAD/DEAH box helicase domain-containing protein
MKDHWSAGAAGSSEQSTGNSADAYFADNGWAEVHRTTLPGREKTTYPVEGLPVSPPSRAYLKSAVSGIYLHQKTAIEKFLAAQNVCLTTGTASGKSLPYYVAALEVLHRSPESRVLVIYPLKALGREQEDRWKRAIRASGLNVSVGRIDGQVHVSARPDIVRRCRVLIMTPDIIHAWVLSGAGNRFIVDLLRQTRLIVVDEVHNYSGVFGSNAALLFRRVHHLMNLLGNSPRYLCASATISDPEHHLRKLLGVSFELVGSEFDTSPKYGADLRLVAPPRKSDLLSEVSRFLQFLARKTKTRFLAFVDSRKQAEQIASIVARTIGQEDDDEDEQTASQGLEHLNVLPFRAGYEERDRDLIQDRLNSGTLRGVVSTSALELGIDIPHLDSAVLIGVPSSLTSFFQRIGRIGRHKPGQVFVVNTGSIYDEAVFREPESLLKRPLAESALYLENVRLQYIHALCLARHEGEHDQVAQYIKGHEKGQFTTKVEWPEGFVELCEKERRGEIPIDLQAMKSESGDDPNHVYPLRDVESQYKVELHQGPNKEMLGSLSHSQLMREAYPGAVYYYATRPLRVYRIWQQSKLVVVRQEKRYTTKPNKLPTLVFPNFSEGNVYGAKQFGDLVVVECNLQVRETVTGYKERRGNSELITNYPTDFAQAGIAFDLPRFTRNFFTTGVLLTHPALSRQNVKAEGLAPLVYEAFVMAVPFERQDINFAADKHRSAKGPITEGTQFLALYDQTYGSLHLTGRLMEDDVLRLVLSTCLELAENNEEIHRAGETLTALREIAACVDGPGVALGVFGGGAGVAQPSGTRVQVILPGSKGLSVHRNNEDFEVKKIQFHPSVHGLAYRGNFLSTKDSEVLEFLPISDLIPVPGESELGWYDYDLGEIVDGNG